MTRAGWLSLVLGVSAAAIVVVPLVGETGTRASTVGVSIPDRIAGYSLLTADVTDAPTGPALALYQRGLGVEFVDTPQAVVLAADDDAYRRVDAAEERSGPEDQGDPGPMLLSPDGSSVALGDHDTRDPDVGVVDLGTGHGTRYTLTGPRSVVPVAWSHDGSKIAYLAGRTPTNPHAGGPTVGELYLLDVDSGEVSSVPGVGRARTAAFSPDGRQLAVRPAGLGGGTLPIVDLATGTLRTVPADGVLTGPAAWSPDGELVAVSSPAGLAFVAVDGSAPGPAELELDHPQREQLLGWTGDREVAVLDRSDPDTARLVAHPLSGGPTRRLTRIDHLGTYGISHVQLASALLPQARLRPAGSAGYGPLPARFRFPLAVVIGLAVAGVALLVLRRLLPGGRGRGRGRRSPRPYGGVS
ncbi:TolB family protein [Nocardioides sp. URHA0020]|uniref:TolB family protein n=1 Tax=Nocardioides sp. URHA0020 TaxID=1380392 RepID=UPI00048B18C2|nr:hypothetical protein [Nocardioides sp. URHA0020]